MAQQRYRGNLSARVFPFLASQFGQSVIIGQIDQASAPSAGEAGGGDNNSPQAYYMHNIVPTAQGYKSIGYKQILAASFSNFDRVIPTRDPNMVRGWIGVTTDGRVYMFRAGDAQWVDVTGIVGNWQGGDVSVAYANGATYFCLSEYNVFKLAVTNRTLAPVVLNGLDIDGITAITANANYLIVTDGVRVYWSSTISPEDFVPSQITGAGSGTPNDVEGKIIALAPLGTGFAIYTSVNIVIASYSQNVKYPFIFKGASNSKGISDVQHIAHSADDGANYAWTSAGIQKIMATGAVSYIPEVTDFLAGKKYEDWNDALKSVDSKFAQYPLKVKLSYVGARYLVISYGPIDILTYALIYDTSLRRWGKLKLNHVSCFDVSLNSDGVFTSSESASAKKTLGFVTAEGSVSICNFDARVKATDSVLILGKFQMIRSRLITLEHIEIENAEDDCVVNISTSLDGRNAEKITSPYLAYKASGLKEYNTRVTGVNHSVIIQGTFDFSSFELAFNINGRR